MLTFRFERELTERLRRFNAARGSTLYVTLLTALIALLYRHTGQEEIVVGTPVSGRNHPDVEELVGFLVNDIVLHNRVRGDMSFIEALAAVREATFEAYEYQEYPFDRLVDELRPRADRSRFPLYDLSFNVDQIEQEVRDRTRARGASEGVLRIRELAAREDYVLQPDMIFYAKEEDDAILFSITYTTGLFEERTITALFEGFRRSVEQASSDPGVTLSALRLEERADAAPAQKVDFEFNF
jgi:non-ribosomal peptide synthetase component F